MCENSAHGSVDVFMSGANAKKSKAERTRVLGEEWGTQAESGREGHVSQGQLYPGQGSLGI